MKLRFLGAGALTVYRSAAVPGGMRAGDVEDFDDDVAEQMLADFGPRVFQRARGAIISGPILLDGPIRPDEAGGLHRAVTNTRPQKPSMPAMPRTVGRLIDRLSAGTFDPFLPELLAAERGGKNRKGATAAIRDRAEAIGVSLGV